MTPGGATHQAIEDIAVMRSLPNMTILETGMPLMLSQYLMLQ
jgi:transketolase